jgi:hypothetical protein
MAAEAREEEEASTAARSRQESEGEEEEVRPRWWATSGVGGRWRMAESDGESGREREPEVTRFSHSGTRRPNR